MRNLRPHSEGDRKPGSSLRHLGSELPLSPPWAASAHLRDEGGIQVIDPHVTSGPDKSHIGTWWGSAGMCHPTACRSVGLFPHLYMGITVVCVCYRAWDIVYAQ